MSENHEPEEGSLTHGATANEGSDGRHSCGEASNLDLPAQRLVAMQTRAIGNRWLTMKEAATYAFLSYQHFRNLCSEDEGPQVEKSGRHVRVLESVMAQWLEARY